MARRWSAMVRDGPRMAEIYRQYVRIMVRGWRRYTAFASLDARN